MQLIIVLLSFSLLLVACDKPNPEPEKVDPIYLDMEKEAAETESQIKTAEKDLEGFQKDLENVVPQTGQIKYAEKRVSEATAKLEKLKQMRQYWEIRLETRKQWDRKQYLAAYKAKKPWPESSEYEQYKIQRKLEQAPKSWNLKKRMEEAGVGINFESGAGAKKDGHGEDSAPAKGGEHGEHWMFHVEHWILDEIRVNSAKNLSAKTKIERTQLKFRSKYRFHTKFSKRRPLQLRLSI